MNLLYRYHKVRKPGKYFFLKNLFNLKWSPCLGWFRPNIIKCLGNLYPKYYFKVLFKKILKETLVLTDWLHTLPFGNPQEVSWIHRKTFYQNDFKSHIWLGSSKENNSKSRRGNKKWENLLLIKRLTSEWINECSL